MSATPAAVTAFLLGRLESKGRPAWVQCAADGDVVAWDGDWGHYGVAGWRRERSAAGVLDCLEGLWPVTAGGELDLPNVELRPGCWADVHAFAADGSLWIVVQDVSAVAHRQVQLQQRAYELALLAAAPRLAAPGDPTPGNMAAEVLAAIDIVLLECREDGLVDLLTPAPPWFLLFVPEAGREATGIDLGERFPFLRNFLVDARQCWAGSGLRAQKSGMWFERDEAGTERAFEATAVRVAERRLLLMDLLNEAFIERRELIQRAREGKLMSHQLRRAGERLARQTEELTRSNAELEQFAYVASHDLRAPLRAINALTAWLEEDLGTAADTTVREHLTLLKDRVGRMDRLIESLLQYARVGATTTEPVTVDVDRMVRELVAAIDVDRRFEVEVNTVSPLLQTWRAPLEQVLHNLIDNAIKHHDGAAGHIRVDVRREGEWWRFRVSDDGPGIPASEHERIFRMFQTVPRPGRSTSSGMGLALVKRLVTQQGGTITVGESSAAGTQFQFTWPAGVQTP